MQDDRVSKTPFWQQPVLLAAGAAVLLVVGGVGWMIYSAEELDARLDKLDRAAADAERTRRLGEHDQASEVSARLGQDSALQESRESAVPAVAAVETPSKAPKGKSGAAQSKAPAAATDSEPGEAASSRDSATPASVEIPETPSSEPQERDANSKGSPAPAVDSPRPIEPQSKAPLLAKQPEASQEEWLKLDENGEPCEVTLDNGRKLKLETFGDEYEAYEWRKPLMADDAKTYIDYAKLGFSGAGAGSLTIAAKSGKMYWVDGDVADKSGSIRRANLDGSHFETVLGTGVAGLGLIAIDENHDTLYFFTVNRGSEVGGTIQAIDLNGKNRRTIVSGLKSPKSVAVDSASQRLYYVDDANLIRCRLNGADEERILEYGLIGPMEIDHQGGQLYWTAYGAPFIKTVRLDGTESRDVIDFSQGGSQIQNVAVDHEAGKIYWLQYGYGNIRRANLDGTQVEDIVIGAVGATWLALDTRGKRVYWIQNLAVNGTGTALIRGASIPPVMKPKRKPAPPFVLDVAPSAQAANGQIVLHGRGFGGVRDVVFVDDGDGSNVSGEVVDAGDATLTVAVPKLSSRCRHPVIVVKNEGGITATLPTSLTVVPPGPAVKYDRFHPDKDFVYLAPPKSFVVTERAFVVGSAGSTVGSAVHGGNTFFHRAGTVTALRAGQNNVNFFEPFAVLNLLDELGESNRAVPVPAIRPSFLKIPFQYNQDKPTAEQ